jgi:hypothetical protein
MNPGPQIVGKTVDWQQRTVNNTVNVRPAVVEVSDFDGDGLLDVVVGYEGDSSHTPAVYIFFQVDVDTFTAIELAASNDLDGVSGLAVEDVDSDGQDDVIAACNGRLVYLHSPPNPRTAAGWTLNTVDQSDDAGVGQWSDVAVGDINGANGLDIVACNSTGGWLSWFANPGNATTGTGWTRTHIDNVTRDGAVAVLLDDIDSDGRTDVFSTAPSETTARIAWYANPTDPVNGTWTRTTIGNLTAVSRVADGDLDLDGQDDLVVVNGPGRVVGWYAKPTNATSAWPGYQIAEYTNTSLGPPRPIDVKVADVDGDSQLDVIVATEQAGTLRWFIPVGAQTLGWGENNIKDLTEDLGRIAVGDIDGDGRPDVVAPLRASTNSLDAVAWFENPE